MAYQHIRIPESGQKITVKDGKLRVPDQPIIGYVEGDGIGKVALFGRVVGHGEEFFGAEVHAQTLGVFHHVEFGIEGLGD